MQIPDTPLFQSHIIWAITSSPKFIEAAYSFAEEIWAQKGCVFAYLKLTPQQLEKAAVSFPPTPLENLSVQFITLLGGYQPKRLLNESLVRTPPGKLMFVVEFQTRETEIFGACIHRDVYKKNTVQKVAKEKNDIVALARYPMIRSWNFDQTKKIPSAVPRCYGCDKEAHLFKCSRCLCARYCSPECFKTDWLSHKEHCETLKTMTTAGREWLDLHK